MSVAGTLVDQLLKRVRDQVGTGLSTVRPGTTASGRQYALVLLSQAQNYINAWEKQAIVTAPLTPQPYQGIFPISTSFQDSTFRPLFTAIVGIRDENGHSLAGPIPFHRLAHSDLKWMLTVAGRYRTFSLFGKDILILYPTLDRSTTITAVGVQNIPDLKSESDLLTLTDDLLPQVMDLAEAFALFKLRQLESLKPVLDRLVSRYKSEQTVDYWMKQLGQGNAGTKADTSSEG